MPIREEANSLLKLAYLSNSYRIHSRIFYKIDKAANDGDSVKIVSIFFIKSK
jgi:hypothetical protein